MYQLLELALEAGDDSLKQLCFQKQLQPTPLPNRILEIQLLLKEIEKALFCLRQFLKIIANWILPDCVSTFLHKPVPLASLIVAFRPSLYPEHM